MAERATVKHGSRYGRDSLTDVIQQRTERIVELFGQKVDLDEVKRMSNGKWVCLICHWRPVLDTVEVLMVHRNSKKHKAQVEARKQKEQETEEKKLQPKRPFQQATPSTNPSEYYQNQYPGTEQYNYDTTGYYNYYQYPGYQSTEQYTDNTQYQYYDTSQPNNDNATQDSPSQPSQTQPINPLPVIQPQYPQNTQQAISQPSKKAKIFSYEEFRKEVEWNKWATLCKQKGWTLYVLFGIVLTGVSDEDNKMKKVEGVEFDSDDEAPAPPEGKIPTSIAALLKKNVTAHTDKKEPK